MSAWCFFPGFGLSPDPPLPSFLLFSLGSMVAMGSPLLHLFPLGQEFVICSRIGILMRFSLVGSGKGKKCEVVEVESEPFQDHEDCDLPHEASSTTKGKEKESITPASKKQKRAKGQGVKISG